MLAATVVSWVLGIARGMVVLALVLMVWVLVVPWSRIQGNVEVDASLVGVGSRMTIPVRFYVDADAHRITAPLIGVARAELVETHGSLRFPAQKDSFLFINAAAVMAFCVLAIWGLTQMHRVFGTLRKGQPFTPVNASRLRRVAIAVIAGELLRASMVAFNQFYAKTHFTATGLLFDWSFNIDFFGIVLGLIILAIAEVFAAGTRLDEDQALTI
jgi:hypothetical protein